MTVTLAVPDNMEFLERRALFSEGPDPWGAPRFGSWCGFMTCQEAGVCGWGLLCALTPEDTEPRWSGLHCWEGLKASLLLQAQDSFISVCTELEKKHHVVKFGCKPWKWRLEHHTP